MAQLTPQARSVVETIRGKQIETIRLDYQKSIEKVNDLTAAGKGPVDPEMDAAVDQLLEKGYMLKFMERLW